MKSLPIMGGEMRNFFRKGVVNTEWSPDETRVVYHTAEMGDRGDPLFVADANGENPRQILATNSGLHQHFPIWSSDGEWIYVVRGRPATLEMDLWRVRPDGGDLEQMTWDKRDVGYPAPVDAGTVLYVARETSGAGPWLWQLDVESRTSQRISIGVEQYTSIAASKDGSRLVATVANPRAHLWSVPIFEQRVAAESDAAPLAQLEAVRGLAPRFAPDCLFFLSSRGAGDGLCSTGMARR